MNAKDVDIAGMLRDYFGGRSLFSWIFLTCGIIVQVVTFAIAKEHWLSLVSGVTGVLTVVMCSQKKMSNYFYGVIQTATYVVLCIQEHFYGELGENVYYFITMALGWWLWSRHYVDGHVKTRKFTAKTWGIAALALVGGTCVLREILALTNDPQPWMDSLSTIPALIAQMLLILRYREQWVFWFMIDIASTIMWAVAGNWCMVAQFVFWGANCIYGYILWGRDTSN